jgi:RES domain-containing protein
VSVVAWRVVPRKYSAPPYNPFDGEGASAHGGRWNSVGVPVVYTSATRSLAILEKLVHADGVLAALRDCVVFSVEFPDRLVQQLDLAGLPDDWGNPVGVPRLKELGDEWVRQMARPVLRVPSAVVTAEDNFVLNPRHPEFPKLLIGERQPLPIDPRLLGTK